MRDHNLEFLLITKDKEYRWFPNDDMVGPNWWYNPSIIKERTMPQEIFSGLDRLDKDLKKHPINELKSMIGFGKKHLTSIKSHGTHGLDFYVKNMEETFSNNTCREYERGNLRLTPILADIVLDIGKSPLMCHVPIEWNGWGNVRREGLMGKFIRKRQWMERWFTSNWGSFKFTNWRAAKP